MNPTPATLNTALQRREPGEAFRSAQLASKAKNTHDAYASDWRSFEAYCDELGVSPLPPEAVIIGDYFDKLLHEGKSSATIERRRAGLLSTFRKKGYPQIKDIFELEPFVEFFSGVARMAKKGKPQEALDLDKLLKVIGVINTEDLRGVRDKAFILLHWAGIFRNGELRSLQVSDLSFRGEGISVFVERSKSDQEAKGMYKPIYFGDNPQTCPVLAVKAWLDQSFIKSGPLFRGWIKGKHRGFKAENLKDSPISYNQTLEILKKYCMIAGLDAGFFGTHSLRSGFATEAANQDKSTERVMSMAGWKSHETATKYRKQANVFKAGTGNIGL